MNKQREFTYEDGYEDGIQSGKEECIEILERCKKEFLEHIVAGRDVRYGAECAFFQCISWLKNSM